MVIWCLRLSQRAHINCQSCHAIRTEKNIGKYTLQGKNIYVTLHWILRTETVIDQQIFWRENENTSIKNSNAFLTSIQSVKICSLICLYFLQTMHLFS